MMVTFPLFVLLLLHGSVANRSEFTYQRFKGYRMVIPDGEPGNVGMYEIEKGETVEQCKEACSAKADCKMFNHLKKEGKCFMKSLTKDDKPDFWKRKRKYDAYVK